MDQSAIARKVYEEQKRENWPGLAKETQEICEELKIENVNITSQNKKTYRKMVTEACHKLNEERLRKDVENKDKCERIMKEPYGRKKYVFTYIKLKRIMCSVKKIFIYVKIGKNFELCYC